ncbi:TonB-dependent receptor [Sphingosinithalassobacter tenebrarum]|uniref:TonB-dependent receptor n=2 Tax=Stakelama tenebrarum TaxID=2711215 RepID=A0A6G6Y9Z3_9SPHN|nr:TonB-dependent receptor [Sphingosinithalassobacter tenebrarum]
MLTLPNTAYAQNAEPDAGETREATGQQGEFLGTIDIGESTRAVQTNTATPATAIDREEIEDREASTIAELVDSVPGVTLVNGSTPIGSGINIRGFGANGTYGTDQKVAVQIDGASVGSEELYRIGTQLFTDPLLYKSVEVIRGTVGSFEYGSGIIGGIVRLETSDASDLTGGRPGFALNQVAGYNSNGDGWNSSTTVAAMPNEHVEFLANYSWREQNNLQDGNGDEIPNSEFGLPSWLIKGGVHFGADNAHTIEASFSQTETSERDKPYDSFGTSGGSFGNVDRDTKSQVATLGYTFDPIADDAVNLSLLYSYANQEIVQEYVPGSSPYAPPGGFDVVNADQQYETHKVTLKNIAYFDTGSLRHNLRIGLEYVHKDRLDANSAPGGTDKRMAAFLVDEIALFPGFTLTPAMRWESQTVKGTLDSGADASYENEALMGGVSARYELPVGFAVFGSWAYTENLPILDDLENDVYMSQSEQAETWEAGASFDHIGLLGRSDRAAFKVNYYDTDLTDVTSYSGVSAVRLEGFEIEGSYAAGNGLYLDFNINLPKGEQTDTGGAVSDWDNTPPDSYAVSVGKRFGDLLNLRWESYFAADADRNGTVTEGFDSHNLRLIVTPSGGLLDGLALRLSVENLFDSYYTPLLSTRPAPGRNFKFSISKLF